MAVSMNHISRNLYQGLSSDQKPTSATVEMNAVFYETDTQIFYLYTGTAWVACNSVPPMN